LVNTLWDGFTVGVGVAVTVGVAVAVGVDVTMGMEVNVAVTITMEAGAGLGMDCWVWAMAAETVPATIVSMTPASNVSVGRGAEAVGSPGTTQARMIAKKIGAMKKFRLLFIVFLLEEWNKKKPPGYYSREASLILRELIRERFFSYHFGKVCAF
jgi:hypothetical protein